MRMVPALSLVVLFIASGSAHGQNRPQRPFDDAAPRRPSVSPYMNLVNNPLGAATNYQSLVRPQIEQNNFNSRQSSAIAQLQRQAAPIRTRSSAQGNQQLRSTGHRTLVNDKSRYYPGAGANRCAAVPARHGAR